MRSTVSRHRVVLAGVAAVALVVGGWLTFQAAAQPSAPSGFYTPPDELPAGPPGTIVRSERVASPAPGERAWRVLYTSTDPSGSPVAVSGIVVAPDGPAPAGGWPVIAWAHGTTGVASRCAPSLEADGGIARVPAHERIVGAGTVLAITDYPGLGTPGPHPYLVGESEGRAVLDSIRAAQRLLGDEVSGRAAIFGHSQGGHAALFADQLAPAYAPELHVAGVAAMAPPTDLAQLLTADVRETPGIALTALAVRSWSEFYPDADEAAVVKPPARELLDDLASRCLATTAQGLTDLADVLGLHLDFLAADPTTQPGWSQHFAANSPGDLPIGVPLLVAQGLTDVLVRPAVTERYVAEQCAAGVPIRLDTYAGTGHFAVRDASASAVATWLLDRLAARPATPGCSTNPVDPTSEDPS